MSIVHFFHNVAVFFSSFNNIPRASASNFSCFKFYFQKTEEGSLKRKRASQLAQCRELAEQIQVEMEGVKFLEEQQVKEPEKLDGEGMEKLLKKLKKTAKQAIECGECTHDIREKLNFQ